MTKKGKSVNIKINRDTFLNVRGFSLGVLNPLKGFCSRKDYRSIVNDMRLTTGEVWPIPITLEVPEDKLKAVKAAERIKLMYSDEICCAEVIINDVFKVKKESSSKKIFGTACTKHPGVMKKQIKTDWRAGGKVIPKNIGEPINQVFMSPLEVKGEMERKGWSTMAGFQTRNPIHKAHEYLQTVAMNVCDGIFIQPQIGWLKPGDFSIKAIIGAYKLMIKQFYGKDKVIFSSLELPMNYAGPREAVLHAIVRRNYGCSHFVVGRDHAGVGNYYGKYEAQKLALSIKDLGIKILPLKSPFYCKKCDGCVTEKNCSHFPGKDIKLINGKDMRKMIRNYKVPNEYLMRKEIGRYLVKLAKKKEAFCE